MSQRVSCDRQPHVLAAPADGQRELLVRHHDLDAAGFLVHHHLGDLGGRQRVHHEGGGLRRPGDDVDLLALQFLHHRLHARAAHADAGADRIDRAESRLITAILARLPGSRATALISMMPS